MHIVYVATAACSRTAPITTSGGITINLRRPDPIIDCHDEDEAFHVWLIGAYADPERARFVHDVIKDSGARTPADVARLVDTLF